MGSEGGKRLGAVPARTLRRAAVAAAAVVAAVTACVLLFRQASAQPVEVYPVYNLATYSWDQSTAMGSVSEGREQSVALRDAAVESVDVVVGQRVRKGDVLVTYDTESFRIALMGDEAAIATYEARIAQDEQSIARYGSLKPSELAPQPTYRTIDHGDLALEARLDGTPRDGATYRCSEATVATSAFLKALRAGGASVTLELYAVGDDGGKTLVGSLLLVGSELPEASERDVYEEYAPAEDPDAAGDPESGEQSPAATGEPVLYTRTTETQDPLDDDWALGESLSLTENGVEVAAGARLLGTLVTQTPEPYERYETVEVDPPETSGDDYVYSRAELAQMIADARKDAQEAELSLRQARLTYQMDRLIAEDGQVTAAIDGTVTLAADPTTLAVGDALVAVSGEEDYVVTLYVGENALAEVEAGDVYDVTTWQSGEHFTATVAEVGETPLSGDWSYGDANPNTSWYPVTCVVDAKAWPDVEPVVGEGCEATRADAGGSDVLCLERMYVRSDADGSYVMAAGADGLLERRAVTCGRVFYGEYVEVLSGISEDDRIAFPYGTDVASGARTVDADYPDTW